MLALLLFATSFTDSLWASVKTIYPQTLQHPFLRGISAGTLTKDRFQFYLLQDAQYLGTFSEALSLVAEKAPRESWAAILRRHASEAVAVEREFHDSVLGSYGVSKDAVRRATMAPTNYAYTNHLMVTAARGSFAEGLAAMLPCYWIYMEVGKELKKRGSKNPDYQRWIDQYSSADYAKSVAEVLEMMNQEADTLTADQRIRCVDLFVLSARYEYMFWDMAWRMEAWPPAPQAPPRPPVPAKPRQPAAPSN
jgi:thiaminase/transcriptional activator TenA